MQTVKAIKEKGAGGRPKKDVKREAATGVRFTKAEYFIVKQKAAKAGLKITPYIRQMAIRGQVISRLTAEERQDMRKLIGMAANFNQLTKAAHKEGILSAVLAFQTYRKELDEFINRVKTKER